MYKIIACCGLLNSQCFDFIPVVLNFGCIEHFIWSPEVQYIYVRKDNSEVTCNHVLAQVTLPINSSKVKQSLLIMTVYTICTLLNLQQSGKKKDFSRNNHLSIYGQCGHTLLQEPCPKGHKIIFVEPCLLIK